MATYIALNLAVMAVVFGVIWRWRRVVNWRAVGVVLAVMLLLTAVFDSFIIMTGIVAYDSTKLLGLLVGAAPIEDFAYTIMAAVLAPLLWIKLKDIV